MLSAASLLGLSSCTKDLDRFPTNGETPEKIFSDPAKTLQALAKVYGAYGRVTGGMPEKAMAPTSPGLTRARATSYVSSSSCRSSPPS